MLWCSSLSVVANCFSVAQNTRPVLFIMMILSYNSMPGAHYSVAISLPVWYFLTTSPRLCRFFNLFIATLILFYLLSSTLPLLAPLFPNLFLHFFFSLSLCPLLLLSNFLAHFSFPFLTSSPFSPLHFCSSLLPCASLSFICLSFLFALLSSSAPLHWAACNRICTTSCQFDRIHASVFRHLRRKRDWSFLSYLSHVSEGRISMKSIWK